jgi:hypothetical protein
MGICGMCQGTNDSYVLKDEFQEFRSRFFNTWKVNPFFTFKPLDFQKINNIYQEKILNVGDENFNEEEFINSLPKLDNFMKKNYSHFKKFYYTDFQNTMNENYDDVKYLFFSFVFYFLANPGMQQQKLLLSDFLNKFAKKPKKEKKATKGNDQDKKPQSLKKKINLSELTPVLTYLIGFVKQILSTFVLNFIFVNISETKKTMDTLDLIAENQFYLDLETQFNNNLKTINANFSNENFCNIWIDYIIDPLNKRKYFF